MELLLLAAAALVLGGLAKKKAAPPSSEQPLPPQPTQNNGGGDRTSGGPPNVQEVMGGILGGATALAGLVKAGLGVAAGVGSGVGASAGAGSGIGAGTAAAPTVVTGSVAGGESTVGLISAEAPAIVGLSAAEGIAGLVYIVFVVAELVGLFVAARRQRWSDWYGGGSPNGIENRYRSMLVNFETQHNEEVAKRCPQEWWPNGTRRWDADARTYVLIPPTVAMPLKTVNTAGLPMMATLPVRIGIRLSPTVVPQPVRPEWLEVCAVHRLFAVERLARWNSILWDFYRSRQWTEEQLETQQIAMSDAKFQAFIADELAAQRNSAFLGYTLQEVSREQLQGYIARYVSVEKGVKWARVQGEAYAITRAAVDGFGFGWPGDSQFVDEIKWRCNLSWSHVGARVLVHPELPVGIDVVLSREQEIPVTLDMRTPQQIAEAGG